MRFILAWPCAILASHGALPDASSPSWVHVSLQMFACLLQIWFSFCFVCLEPFSGTGQKTCHREWGQKILFISQLFKLWDIIFPGIFCPGDIFSRAYPPPGMAYSWVVSKVQEIPELPGYSHNILFQISPTDQFLRTLTILRNASQILKTVGDESMSVENVQIVCHLVASHINKNCVPACP